MTEDIYRTPHRSQEEERRKKSRPFNESRRSAILFWCRLSAIVIGLGWGTAKAGVSTLLWLRGQDLEKLESRIKLGEDFLHQRDAELSQEFRDELARTKKDILGEIKQTREDIMREIRQWRDYSPTVTRADISDSTP